MAGDNLVKSQEQGRFRILSLDGGGSRGYLTARILANIENYINTKTGSKAPLGQRFDLLAGTSTGGIIALALATGMSAEEVASFYAELVPQIFDPKIRSTNTLSYPKYPSDRLKQALNAKFGNATLDDAKTDVCVTGVSLASGKPRLHKSLYSMRYLDRRHERLADVALATAAAPTYFKAALLTYSRYVVDGGLFANNPAMVALVDTKSFERPSLSRGRRTQNLEDVWLLSIGTGDQRKMPYEENDLINAGLISWARHITDVMFESQSAAVDFQVRALLPDAQYIRINPVLERVFELDDTAIHVLENLVSVRADMHLDRFFAE